MPYSGAKTHKEKLAAGAEVQTSLGFSTRGSSLPTSVCEVTLHVADDSWAPALFLLFCALRAVFARAQLCPHPLLRLHTVQLPYLVVPPALHSVIPISSKATGFAAQIPLPPPLASPLRID